VNEDWNRYSEADQAKRTAEQEQKEAEAVMKELEPKLLAQMADDGMDRITIKGVTYSPTRRLYVGPDTNVGANKEAVAAALLKSDLGDYVKQDYNANSLSAYVRSVAEEHGGKDMVTTEELRGFLPEPLRAVLKVGDVWSLGSRKS